MYLDDEVHFLDSLGTGSGDPAVLLTVPAYVGSATTGWSLNSDRGEYMLDTRTSVIMEVTPEAEALAVNHRVYMWRGKEFHQVGEALVRRQHGQDHHMTVTMEVGRG